MDHAIRPNVLEMTPYVPGKPIEEVRRELGLDRIVKLASNENPLGPSPLAVAAVQEAAAKMHLYPDAAAHDLRGAIADRFDIGRASILVGNGSDELIHLLGLAFLGQPDDEVLIGQPSFVRYDAAAQLAPCRLVRIPLDRDMRHDLDAMAAAVTPQTKLIFIPNPHNPTGTTMSRDEIDRFIAKLPVGPIVVLDEAYIEFAEGLPNMPNSLDYVRAGAPVIGLRTFSKAYGLAGIRVGFGFAPEYVVDAINRAREPFNVNSLAQVAAIAALHDRAHVAKTVTSNRNGLETLADAFRAVGARPFQSAANFVLADLDRPVAPVFEALLKRGIITRSGVSLGLPTCLRVSVGTPEENAIFASALLEVTAPAVAR